MGILVDKSNAKKVFNQCNTVFPSGSLLNPNIIVDSHNNMNRKERYILYLMNLISF